MDEREKHETSRNDVGKSKNKIEQKKDNSLNKNLPIIISIIALIFSFGTTGVSYYKSYQEDIRENRREARELIQRVSKLPIENFELMQKHEGSPFGESLSGMINQENILLASQAVELIQRYPNSFSSTEYFAVALALSQSNIRDNVPYLFENAIRRSRNYNDYNISTRAYAMHHFTQGDYLEGRKFYEMALDVWNIFPERNSVVVDSIDLVTLMYWSNAELSLYNYPQATDLIQRARASLTKLPPGPFKDSLARQIADVEKRIEQTRLSQSPAPLN